jgi:NitT/TauT family transport system ATP-binding protein
MGRWLGEDRLVSPPANQLEHARLRSEAGQSSGPSSPVSLASETMIEFVKVKKGFSLNGPRNAVRQEILALHDISARVRRRELVALLGPSGCGKTTLLRIAAGLLPPDSGSVFIEEAPVTQPRKNACMVFQGFGLLPWRTVISNTEFPLELDGVPFKERRDRAREFLALVGMTGFETYYPHQISGGMQQRVGIARALTRQPSILFMDEPFGALDALTRERLQEDFLRIWGSTESTVLFVTHSIDEALTLADRIFVFATKPGRLIEIIDSPVAAKRLNGNVRALPEYEPAQAYLKSLLRGPADVNH